MGPPEEGSVEDDDNGDNKSSCCVRARLHFGPCLSVWLFSSMAERTDSHACRVQEHEGCYQTLLCIRPWSVKGKWGGSSPTAQEQTFH